MPKTKKPEAAPTTTLVLGAPKKPAEIREAEEKSAQRAARKVAANALSEERQEEWQERIQQLRKEPAIQEALKLAKHVRFKVDAEATTQELQSYLAFADRQKAAARKIQPENLERVLDVLHEMQEYKDRAGTLWLQLSDEHTFLKSLYDACAATLRLNRSVQTLRVNDQGSVVDAVLARIKRRLDTFEMLIRSCDWVTRSLRQSYDLVHLQIEIVKLIVYKRPDGNVQRTGAISYGTTERGTPVRKHSINRSQL